MPLVTGNVDAAFIPLPRVPHVDLGLQGAFLNVAGTTAVRQAFGVLLPPVTCGIAPPGSLMVGWGSDVWVDVLPGGAPESWSRTPQRSCPSPATARPGWWRLHQVAPRVTSADPQWTCGISEEEHRAGSRTERQPPLSTR